MADSKLIPQEVVDAMLDEIKTSMQATIDMLTQRNVTYRGAMKQLELHGTAIEARVAELEGELTALRSPAVESGLDEDER